MWLILVGMATYLWAINDNSGDLMRLGMINIGAEYTDSMRETALPEIYPIGENDESRLRQMNCVPELREKRLLKRQGMTMQLFRLRLTSL